LARGQTKVISMGVVLEFKRPTGICAGQQVAPKLERNGAGGKGAAESAGGRNSAAGAARETEKLAAPPEFDDWVSLGAVVAALLGSGGQDSSASAPRSATAQIMLCYEG
jgi:hypothetical protein